MAGKLLAECGHCHLPTPGIQSETTLQVIYDVVEFLMVLFRPAVECNIANITPELYYFIKEKSLGLELRYANLRIGGGTVSTPEMSHFALILVKRLKREKTGMGYWETQEALTSASER